MSSSRTRASRWALSGTALFAACALAAPSAAQADVDPSNSPSPTPTPTATASAPGTQQIKPVVTKPPKPAKKKKKKPKKDANGVDTSVIVAAASAQLTSATEDLARVTIEFKAAKKRRDKVHHKVDAMHAQIQAAQANLLRYARQSYMIGIDPSILSTVAALDSGDPSGFSKAQSELDRVGTSQSVQLAASVALIAQVQSELASVDAQFATAKAQYDLVRLNVATAQDTLGIASGDTVTANIAEQFKKYPLAPCDFKDVHNISTCQQAQQWALSQVAMPTQNWDHLCLGFVSAAYNGGGTIPRAIDMWNGMPANLRHSPDTVAPPGALMFWGPNHVAMSLGNNILVSVDVLGAGRAWIVSFATIQSLWHLQYLGWTPPDFTHG